MSSKVKICGLGQLRDIEMANLYEPDYVGFVFAASSRQVTEEDAESLKAELADGILAAGVFVNAPGNRSFRRKNCPVIICSLIHIQKGSTEGAERVLICL